MLKKILAVAVLGCALLASQAFAYETGEYSKEALRRGDDKPVVVKDYPVVAIEDETLWRPRSCIRKNRLPYRARSGIL